MSRREALKLMAAGAGALAANPAMPTHAAEPDTDTVTVNPATRFELSPNLYMQFMEPLGVTDGSVEAAWDHARDRWREDVVEVTRELAPPMMRWGGIFTDYYRWREGVGPRDKRPPMLNLLWNGLESNQVGTAEFVDFCRQVGAEPLMGVNFESDGRARYKMARGKVRSADAREAVAKCRTAGIRTIMITGDHPDTARTIAEELGMAERGGRVVTIRAKGDSKGMALHV